MKITWSALHDIGTSKVVNASFIWLAMIPFLARVLEALHAAGAQVPKLPFNFIAFYYAALFFTLGAVIFNLYCPKIIKVAPTFGAFAAAQHSLLELKNWMHDMASVHTGDPAQKPRVLAHFLSLEKPNMNFDFSDDVKKGKASEKLMKNYWVIDEYTKPEAIPLLHDFTIAQAEKQHTRWRAAAAIMYGLGFAVFGVVVVLNLIVVSRETDRVLHEHFPHIWSLLH